MYLIDTNIWLELLLEQKKSEEVKEFLENIPANNFYITEFTLYSIGIILFKLKKESLFYLFLKDIFSNNGVNRICLDINSLLNFSSDKKKSKLDFDDRYQAISSEKFNLQIVTFDNDFFKTGIKVLTPPEALIEYKNKQNTDQAGNSKTTSTEK